MDKIDTSKLGITIVHMQNHFLKRLNTFDRLRLKNNINKLIADFENISPIFTLEWENAGGTTNSIASRNRQHKELMFEERGSDGFVNKRYLNAVKELGLDHMIYAGMWAVHCVYDTGVGGIPYGITPVFCGDLSDRDLIGASRFERDIRVTGSKDTIYIPKYRNLKKTLE